MQHDSTVYRQTIDDEDRRTFLKILGLTGAVGVGKALSLGEVREAIGAESAAELAAMGQAIRNDLTGELDAALLGSAHSTLESRFETLPELAAMGTPAADSTAYQELAAPGWTVVDHLREVGFFESVEANLPAFTEDHIASTARELIRSDTLTAVLTEAGFSEREKLALVMNVVTNKERLALWVPTKDIPPGVEFDVEHVPPVHQRAAEGALLWIDDLDQHLWQNQVLLTDDVLTRGLQDVKGMLGGLSLLSAAASDLADEQALSDSQLTAALTASAATMIVTQEDLTNDVYRITDDVRAPRPGGA